MVENFLFLFLFCFFFLFFLIYYPLHISPSPTMDLDFFLLISKSSWDSVRIGGRRSMICYRFSISIGTFVAHDFLLHDYPNLVFYLLRRFQYESFSYFFVVGFLDLYHVVFLDLIIALASTGGGGMTTTKHQ